MPMDIPPHRLLYALVTLTRRVASLLHYTVQQHPSKRLRVSTITLFVIELSEAIDSGNMNNNYKTFPRINVQISVKGESLKRIFVIVVSWLYQ